MKRFRNILVAVGSAAEPDDALRRAAALAHDNGARLTIALCLEEFERDWPLDELRRVIVDALSENLERLAEPIRDQGVPVDVRLLFGHAFIELILLAVSGHSDLVVKAAGGRGRSGASLFGSTDMHLLRKCPCPVWLVKPMAEHVRGGVLAAVDPQDEDGDAERHGVAAAIMELATSLAAADRVPLHVVHVTPPPLDAALLLAPWLHLSADDLLNVTELQRQRRKQRLDALLGRFHVAGDDMHVHFVDGRPEELIPRIAADESIDVLVFATLGRGGIPGLFIGTVAETVLGQVDCSVLTVKPAGFITPVIG